MSKTYQDRWTSSGPPAAGYRECANRYAIVRAFCVDRYADRPFTVLDVGANMSYFGLRLTEDFPACRVVALEYDHIELRRAHLKRSKAQRVLLLNHRLSLVDLDTLAATWHFDLVLALSVLHHLPGESLTWISGLRRLGDCLIVEAALHDSPRARKRRFEMPSDAELLGTGDSHLEPGKRRPIVLFGLP